MYNLGTLFLGVWYWVGRKKLSWQATELITQAKDGPSTHAETKERSLLSLEVINCILYIFLHPGRSIYKPMPFAKGDARFSQHYPMHRYRIPTKKRL